MNYESRKCISDFKLGDLIKLEIRDDGPYIMSFTGLINRFGGLILYDELDWNTAAKDCPIKHMTPMQYNTFKYYVREFRQTHEFPF